MEIKAIRRERSISREALAEAVGVSVFTIRNWEQGQREPSIAHLIKMADFLHCTIDTLVGRTKERGDHDDSGRRRGRED